MDFEQLQTDIKNAIETKLKAKLTELGKNDFGEYVDDFIDFDLHKKSNTLFYDFKGFSFEDLSNESNYEDLELGIYLVFRKETKSNLKSKMLDYTTAFYQMFEESGNNLGGVVDYGIINNVDFYYCVEGDPGINVAELTLHLFSER